MRPGRIWPLIAAMAAAASTAGGGILPERLGDSVRGPVSPVPVPAADRALCEEYRLITTEHAAFTDPAGRRMEADALLFGDSEGAHASYLWQRPGGAIASPLAAYSIRAGLSGETYAVVAGGVTVVERKNYVFRFRGRAPSSPALETMLDELTGIDPAEPGPDECCRYFVASSDRLLLGPVSLSRFAPGVPPSVAAFRLGARGSIARFETPAGSMSRIVFTYRTELEAQNRAGAFRALPGADVRLRGRSLAVIFYPFDREEAEELLDDAPSTGATTESGLVGWDPTNLTDRPMTLDGGISTVWVGYLLGALIAFFRGLVRWPKGIQDRTISLRLDPRRGIS